MKKLLIGASVWLMPVFAFAQVNTDNLATTVTNLTKVVNLLVPLFLAIAVIVFIYGVLRYVIAGGPKEAGVARNYIIWGIVGIAVILAIWGLARLLVNIFGLSPAQLGSDEVPFVNSAGLANYTD
jgi:hypothetical protein